MSSLIVKPEKTEETTNEVTTGEDYIELGKRAFALKKYEQAVESYASALEIMTAKYGDGAPEAVDLYFYYGKALLENAISQTAVLGKEKAEGELTGEDQEDQDGRAGAFLSFSGDAEDDDALPTEDDEEGVDLFAAADKAVEEEEMENQEEAEEVQAEGEPEDDFNAAWEVLDLARSLFERKKDESDEIKMRLADTYIALGDVSLETEKFDQAIEDYTAAVKLKAELLPLSSRQIAEAHYKLGIVLDMTSGRLADAIHHAEMAFESVVARLGELQNARTDQARVPSSEEPKKDAKGKGKATGNYMLIPEEQVSNMTKQQIESEIKDLEELREDLALKVEELKTNPTDTTTTVKDSAPDLVAKALDKELNAKPLTTTTGPLPVNDLTSMVVKKKKKAPAANGDGSSAMKRKAPEADTPLENGSDKKAKIDESS